MFNKSVLLFWVPRILGILYVGFIALFSMDVLNEHTSLLNILKAFLMHNIPTIAVAGILYVAWRKEWLGGLAFIAIGISYAVMVRFRFDWILPIALPLWVIGTMFLVNYFVRTRHHPKQV